jgi:hypothetical protein
MFSRPKDDGEEPSEPLPRGTQVSDYANLDNRFQRKPLQVDVPTDVPFPQPPKAVFQRVPALYLLIVVPNGAFPVWLAVW